MTATAPRVAPNRTKKTHPLRRLTFITAVLVAIVIVIAAASGGGGPSAKITATVQSVVPLDAQHVRVFIRWDNAGKGSGTENCVIDVTAYTQFGDQDGSGYDSTQPNNPLKPGQAIVQYQDIVVTGNNAAQVTSTKDVSLSNCS